MCMASLVPEGSLKAPVKQIHIGIVLRELEVELGSDFHVMFYLTFFYVFPCTSKSFFTSRLSTTRLLMMCFATTNKYVFLFVAHLL